MQMIIQIGRRGINRLLKVYCSWTRYEMKFFEILKQTFRPNKPHTAYENIAVDI